MTPDQLRTRFRDLHEGSDLFVIPNPWDVGSARILESQGFQALATTSSGFAWSLGRLDGQVDLDELAGHVADLAAAVDIPINVDAERCFAQSADDVAATVDALAAAGAAGFSIEDWNPEIGDVDPFETSLARVAAAVAAAEPHGMVVTARAEGVLRGVGDVDAALERLAAFRDAGAECLYAPAVSAPTDIGRLVETLGRAVNVLLLPGVPSLSELADLGVRRVSTGGGLARAAYGALVEAGEGLIAGRADYASAAPAGSAISALISR
ncbi:MAG: isocitrate lyase/phosphoenolpyruvate mutase family protein [Actinomycetota bacterium]